MPRVELDYFCQVRGLDNNVNCGLFDQVSSEFTARNHVYAVKSIHHNKHFALLNLDCPENFKYLFLLNAKLLHHGTTVKKRLNLQHGEKFLKHMFKFYLGESFVIKQECLVDITDVGDNGMSMQKVQFVNAKLRDVFIVDDNISFDFVTIEDTVL